LLPRWQDGAIKLFVTATLLRFRRDRAALFAQGGYEPLTVTGPDGDRICAFARRYEQESVLVAALRFPARPQPGSCPPGAVLPLPEGATATTWTNILTGVEATALDGALSAEQLFSELPVCVLVPAGPGNL
jgi:(1->4)-alpha-D-glucan 1-alpha-D-glucosylmutase